MSYEELEKKKTRAKLAELDELKKKHQQDDNDEIYKTACLSHAIKSDHKFDYIGSKILHNENNLRRRLALESVYIQNERTNACNFKVDTQFLSYNTKQIINAYHLFKKP